MTISDAQCMGLTGLQLWNLELPLIYRGILPALRHGQAMQALEAVAFNGGEGRTPDTGTNNG